MMEILDVVAKLVPIFTCGCIVSFIFSLRNGLDKLFKIQLETYRDILNETRELRKDIWELFDKERKE